jgi:hypothetical protein
MLVKPGLERGEVENEPGNDDGHTVDFGYFEYSLAFLRSESADQGIDPVASAGGMIDIMNHDHGAGLCHGMIGTDRPVADLLQDLVSILERGVGHWLRGGAIRVPP